jgi:5'-nucleotidase
MNQRRNFIKKSLYSSSFLLLSQLPFSSFAYEPSNDELMILHTNDVHSRLEPFPNDGGKYAGLGGVEAREKLISSFRKKNKNVLLLDAGDMFQGTPYFNFFKGETEFKLMSVLGYDAATLGNHDFDLGIEGLVKQLHHANFPIVNCNYDFTNSQLENKIPPYTIVEKNNLRIGILGVGIELNGLVLESNFSGISYLNPIENANKIAAHLKSNKKCDYIVCLSHLGFEYKENKISDKILAKESEHINLIIGGHTHTFLKEPVEIINKKNKPVLINQVGWAGINLGSINIFFNNKARQSYIAKNTVIKLKETSG